MKKLICFDLDGTLTQHRSKLESENRAVLDRLKEKYKIIMVGAGNAPRIYAQMRNYPIDILGNYGMQESRMIGGEFKIVREDTSHPDKEFFIKNIEYLREKYGYTNYKGESVEFHPSGMVSRMEISLNVLENAAFLPFFPRSPLKYSDTSAGDCKKNHQKCRPFRSLREFSGANRGLDKGICAQPQKRTTSANNAVSGAICPLNQFKLISIRLFSVARHKSRSCR